MTKPLSDICLEAVELSEKAIRTPYELDTEELYCEYPIGVRSNFGSLSCAEDTGNFIINAANNYETLAKGYLSLKEKNRILVKGIEELQVTIALLKEAE
jgi:hypothetical protein